MTTDPNTPAESAPEPAPAGVRPDPETARAFAIDAARLAADDKCERVVVLDVRGLSQVSDYLVIATGTSSRQMASVLDHIEELGDTVNRPSFRVSKDPNSTWLLADFVDVVVHLYEPNARAMYDLEMLWGDAQRVPWTRDGRDRQPGDRPGEGA